MAYNFHQWSDGESITAAKLNAIENALAEASGQVDSNVNSLAIADTNIRQLRADVTTIQNTFNNQSITQNAANGNKAWAQVKEAIGYNDELNTQSTTLNERFAAIESINETQSTDITGIKAEINAAKREYNTPTGSLFQKIKAIDDNISFNSGNISLLRTELEDAYHSAAWNEDFTYVDQNAQGNNQNHGVDRRFEYNENKIKALETEIADAHVSNALGKTGSNAYAHIDDRFENIENELIGQNDNMNSRIDTLVSDVSNLSNNKISKADIATNLTTDDDTKILSARQGKLLNTRLDAIDGGSAISTTNGTLATRVGSVESGLSTAEGEINTLKSTVNNSTTGLVATKAIADANKSAIENATTGLAATKAIADANKSAIENATTGLAATKAIADEALTKANNAATASNLNSLTTRVSTAEGKITALEGKDTIVIDKPNSGSNYTQGKPNTTAVPTPSVDADYLIADDEGKYFYWRYINNDWELISGAGDGGSGNTSGYDLSEAAYNELTNHTENTDYYVTKTDGVHHYRWVPGTNNILTEIEISNFIDTTNIKTYNATTSTIGEGNEQVTYLDLYEFDYGVDNTTIDPQASTLRAHIPLPAGGGGSNNNITARLVRIGEETVPVIVNSKVNLYVFFSAWDTDQSYSGNYTFKYNNTTIDTGTFASGAVNATPINWVVVEEPEFNNDVPVINAPDTTKLYIVKTGNTFTQWTYDNSTWSSVAGAPAGFYALDISNYCKTASINNIFSLSVSYGTDTTPVGKTWRVNIYDLYIESEAPETLLINSTNSYGFVYTAFGALDKTLHVLIDNQSIGTKNLSASTSGRADTFTITPTMIQNVAGYIHGVHKIEMYLTANIGGITRTTSKITRDYIWYDVTNTDTPIIIASPYRGQTLDVQQYSTLSIPYQVYQKDTDEITVKYYLDNVLYDEVHLDKINEGTFNYMVTADEGTHTIKIMVEEEYIQIILNVSEMTDVDISPIDNAIIDFDPSTSSNSSINRLPSWTVDQTTYSFTASPNFNWSEDINGGGYKEDENHEKCFVIKAGSYIDLNYPMFANNVFNNGAEMKITFKTAAVRNAEAVWYQNIGEISGKTVGIQLNAHNGWLKTDKAVSSTTLADEDSDEDTITVKGITYTYWKTNTAYSVNDIRVIRNIIYCCTDAVDALATDLQDKNVDLDEDPAKSYLKKWLKIGQLDTEVLATNSYLYFPYSEEDKIELDININKSAANNNFIMSYEDGVPSKAYAYTTGAGGDKITHSGTIRIGSEDCDVYIYRLRYYAEALTTAQILQNFIADGATIDEKIDRYNRNCIYWDSTQERYFTSPSQTASLDPIKLAERMPDVKILMLETPTFTTGKKDFVQGSSLRCLHVKGGKVYESRGDEDNWFFYNGFHAGQGTTSDNYGQAGRNVDFLFEVDGTNYPTKAKNMSNYTPSQDYVSKVVIGEEASEWVETAPNSNVYHWVAARQPETNEVCDDWKGDKCKVSLTESSVPNNYFNLKVNIASSENVNNALFQKRYDDFLAYQSPAQAAQIVRHGAAYRAMGLDTDKTKVKNCMEFVPAVLFVRETGIDINGNAVARNEFNDDKWHFYALGNIGDSKKSDYTRAYDPDDMNEFTCENSDNNTNNGQFQSGVFTYQNHTGAIETDYPAWSETTSYAAGAIVVYDGMVYTRTGSDQAALEENETYSWVAADWTAITYTGWTDQDPPYFAPRTNPNPMEYSYPITSSQWNVKLGDKYLNRKHLTLVTEKFDGDHSFEFRYGCKGDYRDGDLINDTNGNSEIPKDPSDLSKGYKTKDDVQFDINHDVMLAMYEWLITATPEQYENEAPQWFVKSAMEFFYAYTHYYTMMDNRAKNTFWHFAKTGVHRPVSRPVEALYHVYEVADGTVTVSNGVATGNFKKPEGSFNPSGTYYTQYAFDLWVYDCDTAVGIDNNGALVFPYGKEDEDYRVDGEPSSGYAFNGAGSIFWRRLKTTFANEIASIMDQADKKCFNSEDLIEEFDNFQSCFPEEIWRLDIERKYIRTYTGASIDNSITEGKQNARFLMSMMQGRKKYQRRQWIRDQGFYFNSKYNIGDISTNRTEFNIVSPAGDHSLLAVQPDYHLRLTPYQDMYLNVVVGNGTPIPPIRAKANQEYTIKLDDYAAGNFSETRVYIGGFKMISKLGGLAPMYPYSFTLNGLDHLKELDIGTNNSGYRNGNFTELPLTNEVNLPLLETLNIKNCNALATSIGLRTANNLRTVEAVGSNIGGISLPEYTQIETLHLPSTVTDIVLHGARFLKDFIVADRNGTANYTNLYTLNIQDSDYSINYKDDPSDPLPIDWLSIAAEMLEKQSPQTDLSLIGLYSATIGDIQEIDPIAQAKEIIETAGGWVNLEGTVHVTGEWSSVEKAYYGKPNGIWPKLEFDVKSNNEVTRYLVIYKYKNNTHNGEEIYSTYITPAPGVEYIDIPEIYSNRPGVTSILENAPDKPSTKEYYYVFGTIGANTYYTPLSGWEINGNIPGINRINLVNINENNTIIAEAVFNQFDRQYPIYWYLHQDDSTPAYTSGSSTVAYGKIYNGHVPTVQDLVSRGKTVSTMRAGTSANTVSYEIFDGWLTPPINLTLTDNEAEEENPGFKIYAKWRTGTNVPIAIIRDSEGYSPEKLLLLSQYDTIRTNEQYFSTNRRYDITMGYDSVIAGTQLVPLANSNTIPVFDGEFPPITTQISPLSSANNAFTIAIDYKFDINHNYSDNITEAVLMGCYENINNAIYGFRLFYDPGTNNSAPCVRVGFGDTGDKTNQTRIVNDSKTMQYRNIVVLRHAQNDPVIYVYSGIRYNTTTNTMDIFDSLDADGMSQTISWNNLSTEAKLCLGALTTGSINNNTITNAYGTVYWAKYWDKDLGNSECRMLASWPHETITFGVEDYNTGNNNDRVIPTGSGIVQPNIILTSLSTSSYIGPIFKSLANEGYTSGTQVSWRNSWYRTFYNNRVFYSLPISLQSILTKTTNFSRSLLNTNGVFEFQDNSSVDTSDYIFMPTYAETDRSQSYYNNEAQRPYYWVLNSNATVYNYLNDSTQFSTEGSNNNTRIYMNLRFPYLAMKTTANRIFANFDSSTNETVYSKIPNIARGDIFIRANDNVAFIYVTANDINNGAPVIPNNGIFACTTGGWIRAENWWLRSVFPGAIQQSTRGAQIWTQANGAVHSLDTHSAPGALSNYNSTNKDALTGTANGCCICYSFGI